jgi:hypothetical protein
MSERDWGAKNANISLTLAHVAAFGLRSTKYPSTGRDRASGLVGATSAKPGAGQGRLRVLLVWLEDRSYANGNDDLSDHRAVRLYDSLTPYGEETETPFRI